jgi:hypothetical protein
MFVLNLSPALEVAAIDYTPQSLTSVGQKLWQGPSLQQVSR